METLRSLLWQCISLRFLILFIMGTTSAQTGTSTHTNWPSKMSTVATEATGMPFHSTEATRGRAPTMARLPPKEHQSPSAINLTESTSTATSERSLKDITLTSHETSKEPPATKPVVSHQKIIEATTLMTTFHSSAAATATQVPKKATWSGEETTAGPTFVKHPSDVKSNAGKATPSTLPDPGNHTEGRTSGPFTSVPVPVPDVTPAKGNRTGPTEGEKGPPRPHQDNHPTVKDTSTHNFSSSVPTVPTASHSAKSYIGIILLAVFILLLILVIVVVLYVRRRRRSGSTSISQTWSGPAPQGDATASDGDAEQGEGKAGEGETRRSMPLTSFGKRQSRMSSIPMEDMKGKGEREEVQHLLKTGAGGGANLEGPEEANGNLRESPMPSPGEASTSKAAGGASV